MNVADAAAVTISNQASCALSLLLFDRNRLDVLLEQIKLERRRGELRGVKSK